MTVSRQSRVSCNPDHCHILIGLHPDVSVATMARLVKNNSSKWINNNHLTIKKFSWQNGYGAFSYARSQLEVVTRYIINQPAHHRKKTFQQEYHKLLEKFEVDHKKEYVFDFLE